MCSSSLSRHPPLPAGTFAKSTGTGVSEGCGCSQARDSLKTTVGGCALGQPRGKAWPLFRQAGFGDARTEEAHATDRDRPPGKEQYMNTSITGASLQGTLFFGYPQVSCIVPIFPLRAFGCLFFFCEYYGGQHPFLWYAHFSIPKSQCSSCANLRSCCALHYQPLCHTNEASTCISPHEGKLFVSKRELVCSSWGFDAQPSTKLKGCGKQPKDLMIKLRARYSSRRFGVRADVDKCKCRCWHCPAGEVVQSSLVKRWWVVGGNG
mmetsp:Transcript_10060/g.15458  ORF Transcript_10060/g.15458 Transcript_10060/m.15458 type:complete len:264 (+) Transcript_10060:294-1085(+)